MSIPHLVGAVLSVLGVAAAVFPDGFGPLVAPPSADVYEAVERRIRGGMVLGVGLCFFAIPALRPWSVSLPTALVYVVAGALAARFYGLLVDGAVPKQWLWVAVEAVILAAAAVWLWRSPDAAL